MFKRNLTVYMMIVGLVIGSCPCFATDRQAALEAAVEKMGDYQKYKYMLLDSSQFPDVSKEKVVSGPWFVKFKSDGEPLLGVEFRQTFEFINSPIMAVLQYGHFADTNAAEEALASFFTNSAEPFQTEPWPDTHLANDPDQIWFSSNSSMSMIVYRYGAICILLSSHKGSVIEQRKNAVFFADAIMKHLRELQGEEKMLSIDSGAAETNTPTPAKKEPPIRSVETTPEPVQEPEVPAPSPKSVKHTPRVAPWLVLLCISGLAAFGWRTVRKNRVANKE